MKIGQVDREHIHLTSVVWIILRLRKLIHTYIVYECTLMCEMYVYIHSIDVYIGTLEETGYLLYMEAAGGRFVLKAILLFDQIQGG